MKRLTTILLAVICCQMALAQERTYLVFEYMKVDNEQESSYAETEDFWEKIHEQAVLSGEKLGWDLWALDAGEMQDFQYLTVHVYDDPAKMMEGSTWDGLIANAKKAYPDMSEEQIAEKINHSAKTRDLAARIYLQLIDETEEDFDMPVGTISVMNAMKTNPGQGAAYEKMEKEIFKPMHQMEVDAGNRASWGLARQMMPYGSEVYATHVTFDMYKDYKQMFSDSDAPALTEEQQKAIQEGIATRTLKRATMATLIKKVRNPDTAISDSE